MIVLKRSWPAVSHICSFTRLPSSSIVLILKSMPIVVMKEGVKESSLKRSRQQDLPTPESPISSSLIYGAVPVSKCVSPLILIPWLFGEEEADVQGSHNSECLP